MNSHFSLHIQSDFNLVIVGDTGPMSCTNPQIQADALQTLWANRIWSLCSIQFKWTSFSKSLLSLNVPHVPPSTNPLPPISLSVFDFVLLKHFIFTNSVLILGSPKACPCGEQQKQKTESVEALKHVLVDTRTSLYVLRLTHTLMKKGAYGPLGLIKVSKCGALWLHRNNVPSSKAVRVFLWRLSASVITVGTVTVANKGRKGRSVDRV